MGRVEFYLIGSELWVKHDDGRNEIVDESKRELVSYLYKRIYEDYPKAFDALSKIYNKSVKNITYYQWLVVRRFCKCNFCKLDMTTCDVEDLKTDGGFHFEKVECPLRGECSHEGIICSPVFNTKLSPSEKRVMQLWYKGMDKQHIAEELFLSPETVRNHIKNSYLKLGIHDKADFIRFANNNNIFNQ